MSRNECINVVVVDIETSNSMSVAGTLAFVKQSSGRAVISVWLSSVLVLAGWWVGSDMVCVTAGQPQGIYK